MQPEVNRFGKATRAGLEYGTACAGDTGRLGTHGRSVNGARQQARASASDAIRPGAHTRGRARSATAQAMIQSVWTSVPTTNSFVPTWAKPDFA